MVNQKDINQITPQRKIQHRYDIWHEGRVKDARRIYDRKRKSKESVSVEVKALREPHANVTAQQ